MTMQVGVAGAGLIGRAWAIVFARAGLPVTLYDVDRDALSNALGAIRQSLEDLQRAGLVEAVEPIMARIHTEASLAEAMAGVVYVQECGPEDCTLKQQLYAELESVVSAETILASSTSGIAASRFTSHLEHPERCLVAHPVNPPYLIPLVEVVPTPATADAAVERTLQLMESVGQAPILVRKELSGFVLNRLQGALLNEALRLYRDGYVSAEDLDKTVRHGLGLRWAFMGPFETIDLNAPAGVVDYARRYGPLYREVDRERGGDDPWASDTLAALSQERRDRLPGAAIAERQEWRDRRLMALSAHLRAQADG
ncbi:3-hydroxyacyl-CoA dehydrogenase [Halomonas sp. JS92-SW72]|uniref:3-hydroxyacyl-CoA dehydrogenase n=1 Tax=Halomonas sp. JS92-SW72 TaxID=2306583 RepID=UPI0019692D69|nr:3-hydroxyacyl-CoA dehydrogenase [Halomonas sp. JS92-SW72]